MVAGACDVGVRVYCAFCWGLFVLAFGEGSLGRPEIPVKKRRDSLIGRSYIESSGLVAFGGFDRSFVPWSSVAGLDVLVRLIEFLAVDGWVIDRLGRILYGFMHFGWSIGRNMLSGGFVISWSCPEDAWNYRKILVQDFFDYCFELLQKKSIYLQWFDVLISVFLDEVCLREGCIIFSAVEEKYLLILIKDPMVNLQFLLFWFK